MQLTLQPAEKNFYMLENLWTKLVSNRFMEIMMNINIYNYTMCVCVYIAMIKWYNFVVLQKKRWFHAYLRFHFAIDEMMIKQNSTYTRYYQMVSTSTVVGG